MDNVLSGAKNLLGSKEGTAVADSVMPNESVCPSLSFRTRIIGFIVCMAVGKSPLTVLGIVLESISFYFLFVNASVFAVLYAVGICCILGA